MRKTYAYNSIIFGVLLGILVYCTTESIALTILTGIGVSVVGFFLIRMLEKALYKGADKAAEKITEAYHRRKEQKAIENGTYRKPEPTTQMPVRTATQMPMRPAMQTTAGTVWEKPIEKPVVSETNYCPYCGKAVDGVSSFCPYCGRSIEE